MTTSTTAQTVRGDVIEERRVETTVASLTPSWGAIWAGFFTTLGVEMVFTLLMVGIFASFIAPGVGAPPGAGFTIGIAVWFILQTLGAYYAGGRVVGSFTRRSRRAWTGTHAVAVWGFSTAVIVWALVNASGLTAVATLDAIRFGIGIVVRGAAAIGPAAGGGGGAAALGGTGIAAAASPSLVAVATWIPIYLFIVFGASYFAAQTGARAAAAPVEA